jgi:low affinity Fe/Cu permease
MQERFRIFARRISDYTGSSWAFILAVVVIVAWIAVGPWTRFSDTWQLVINTATTIITFLMVFLIQNTQNRDSRVMQLKLDELLRAVEQARTALVGLEYLPDKDLAEVKAEFVSLGQNPACEAPRTNGVATLAAGTEDRHLQASFPVSQPAR